MRFRTELFAVWFALPLWRATPPAEIPQSTQILLAQDCRKPTEGAVHAYRVTVASSSAQHEKGLSQRKKRLSSDEGMLFWFDPPRPQAVFWMKDTWIPLTLLYFDWDGKLLEQISLQVESDPRNPKKLYPSKPGGTAVGFALEVAGGLKFEPNVRLCLPQRLTN